MRLYISTTKSDDVLKFNYQPFLTGALHKWLGKNNYHDQLSLYSFSWLQGAKTFKHGLIFPEGASYFISSADTVFLKDILRGIQEDPEIYQDLKVREIRIAEEPPFSKEARFFCASPILIKRKVDNREQHFTYMDKESNHLMTETLKNKLRQFGLSDDGVEVCFDDTYSFPKTKVIYYQNIGNKVNLCPIIIKGSPEQIAFAWNVGIGNSTGIGFGALK